MHWLEYQQLKEQLLLERYMDMMAFRDWLSERRRRRRYRPDDVVMTVCGVATKWEYEYQGGLKDFI